VIRRVNEHAVTGPPAFLSHSALAFLITQKAFGLCPWHNDLTRGYVLLEPGMGTGLKPNPEFAVASDFLDQLDLQQLAAGRALLAVGVAAAFEHAGALHAASSPLALGP